MPSTYNPNQARVGAGQTAGGQFAAKEHADAEVAPLGTRSSGGLGVDGLGSLHFYASSPYKPQTPLQHAVVKVDRKLARVKEEASAIHRAAIAEKIAMAGPDIAAVDLDVDDELGTVVVAGLRDAAGEEIEDPEFRTAIDSLLAEQDEYIEDWKEEADFGAHSLTSEQFAVNVPGEIENAPALPEPGTRDASVARAEDVVAGYKADHDADVDDATAARDMLTDLYHWSRTNGVDFDDLVGRATSVGYEEEQEWDAAGEARGA